MVSIAALVAGPAIRNAKAAPGETPANINPAAIHRLYTEWESPQAEALHLDETQVKAAKTMKSSAIYLIEVPR